MRSKKALKISHRKSVLRFVLILCLSLILFSVAMIFTDRAAAEEDLTFVEKAREKKYIGGADESDLKVLSSLPPTKNQKNKNEEVTERF